MCVDEYKEIQVKQKKGESVYIWNSHAIQYLYINTLLKRELPEKEKPVRDFLLSYLRKDRERNIYAKALMAVILNASGEKRKQRNMLRASNSILSQNQVWDDTLTPTGLSILGSTTAYRRRLLPSKQ